MQSALAEVKGTLAMRMRDVRGFPPMCKCAVKQGTDRYHRGAAFSTCHAASSACSSPVPLLRNVLKPLLYFGGCFFPSQKWQAPSSKLVMFLFSLFFEKWSMKYCCCIVGRGRTLLWWLSFNCSCKHYVSRSALCSHWIGSLQPYSSGKAVPEYVKHSKARSHLEQKQQWKIIDQTQQGLVLNYLW